MATQAKLGSKIVTKLLDLLGKTQMVTNLSISFWRLTTALDNSSGTYGRVYKAVGWNGVSGEFAIKKYV